MVTEGDEGIIAIIIGRVLPALGTGERRFLLFLSAHTHTRVR